MTKKLTIFPGKRTLLPKELLRNNNEQHCWHVLVLIIRADPPVSACTSVRLSQQTSFGKAVYTSITPPAHWGIVVMTTTSRKFSLNHKDLWVSDTRLRAEGVLGPLFWFVIADLMLPLSCFRNGVTSWLSAIQTWEKRQNRRSPKNTCTRAALTICRVSFLFVDRLLIPRMYLVHTPTPSRAGQMQAMMHAPCVLTDLSPEKIRRKIRQKIR